MILLDNRSTVDVLSNKNLLQNVRKSNRKLTILSAGGKMVTNLVGYRPVM